VLTRGGSHYYPVVNPKAHWCARDAVACLHLRFSFAGGRMYVWLEIIASTPSSGRGIDYHLWDHDSQSYLAAQVLSQLADNAQSGWTTRQVHAHVRFLRSGGHSWLSLRRGCKMSGLAEKVGEISQTRRSLEPCFQGEPTSTARVILIRMLQFRRLNSTSAFSRFVL
jgi:hypothetical protein